LVNTLVGAGQRGSADGVGVAATSFNQPTAMTIDSTGSTLYVADSGTGLIRRVQVASSTVSTPSLPASTRFIGAQGLATSGSWLYVADTNCHRIVKVNLTAPVTTSAVAGQFPSCSSTWNVYVGSTPDGNGTSARFSFPKGMALSPNGATMYVSDSGFNRIRSVSLSTGVVTTLAGGTAVSANKAGTADGLGNVAMFNGPFGIAIDPTGTILYVADLNNHAIRRIVISPASVSTLAGNVNVPGYLDGVGTTAQLSGPTGIAIDSTGAILYVVDNFNQNLRQVIIATRVVTTIAGSTLANLGWNDALGTSALFSFPTGVVILPGAVTMMVSDTMNNRIRKVDFVQQCQDGVYCPAGTSAILASSCPAGTYCPAGSAPVACPVNTYCSASSPSSAGNSIGVC
jgi:sugar lactone lactonase YvrE